MKRTELLTINEVADRLRLSVPTVTKRLGDRRRGVGNFPMPLTPPKHKAMWDALEIETYLRRQYEGTPPSIDTSSVADALRERHGI